MKVKGSKNVRHLVLRVSGEKADFQIADKVFMFAPCINSIINTIYCSNWCSLLYKS